MTEEEIQRIEERLLMSLQQTMKEVVKDAIQVNVNGKIDKIDARQREYMALNAEHNEKHEEQMKAIHAHIEEVQPILDGLRGVKVIGNVWRWFLGLGITALIAKIYVYGK